MSNEQQLHTYRIDALPTGSAPLGHDYWDWNGTQPTTVPAGVEWYKFVLIAPNGVDIAFEQDVSPVDNGFVPMNAYYADLYGKLFCDIYNGVEVSEIPTIASLESALNEA